MSYSIRLLLVVPLVDLDRARQAAAGFDPVGWAETFTLPLSVTGLQPATHYAAGVQMRPGTAAAVADLVANEFPLATLREYDIATPEEADAIFAGLGLKRVQEPIL